jgi:hypothetical protein
MTDATRRARRSRLWHWGLGGLSALGVGLSACSIACFIVVPTLLALGVSATAISTIEAVAGPGGKVLVAFGASLLAVGAARWWRMRRGCACDGASTTADTEPIACTLDGGGMQVRLAEFRKMFERAYVAGERLEDGGVRWKFRAAAGVENDLRDLAEREQLCCRFFRFDIRATGDELWWDTRVDDPEARPVLEEFFTLPNTVVAPERESSQRPAFWPGRDS